MLICGIDEAGRGPLIGPMVMAGVLVDYEGIDKLKEIGVKDSKLLSQKQRVILFKKIMGIVANQTIAVVSAGEIDEALESEELNLNWLEAHTTAKIINELKPDKAVVDCPSNNVDAYRDYLRNLLDNKEVELVVEHKADINYTESAAASILAKVTRESEIDKMKKEVGDFGSGYLTDPKTMAFFEKNYKEHSQIFRKTWAPYKKKMESEGQSNLGSY